MVASQHGRLTNLCRPTCLRARLPAPQVLVRVAYAGVNASDVNYTAGRCAGCPASGPCGRHWGNGLGPTASCQHTLLDVRLARQSSVHRRPPPKILLSAALCALPHRSHAPSFPFPSLDPSYQLTCPQACRQPRLAQGCSTAPQPALELLGCETATIPKAANAILPAAACVPCCAVSGLRPAGTTTARRPPPPRCRTLRASSSLASWQPSARASKVRALVLFQGGNRGLVKVVVICPSTVHCHCHVATALDLLFTPYPPTHTPRFRPCH